MAVYSQNLINLCKKHKLQIEDLIFCVLTTQGWNHRDSYIGAFRPNNNNPKTISMAASKKLKEEAVQKYLFTLHEITRREDSNQVQVEKQLRTDIEQEFAAKGLVDQAEADPDSPDITLSDVMALRDKAAIIKEINENITKCTDNKQKQDWLKMLIDVQQMKKDSDETEEDTQLYYIPLSCRDCQLKKDSAGTV